MRIEADRVATIVVDLVELTFIGSLGVHAFMAARERALANGRRLLLLGATTNVRRVFELTGTAFLLEDALGADLDPSPLGG